MAILRSLFNKEQNLSKIGGNYMDILQSLFNKKQNLGNNEQNLEVNITDVEYYIEIDGKLEFLGKCTSDIPEYDREFNFKVSLNEDATRYEHFESIRATSTRGVGGCRRYEVDEKIVNGISIRTSSKSYKECIIIEQSNGVSTKKGASVSTIRTVIGFKGDKGFEMYLDVEVRWIG